MSVIPEWVGSPEEAESKKEAVGYIGRIATVKADIARIKPKVSAYTKETLEKLATETKAKYDVVSKLNAGMSDGDQSAGSRFSRRQLAVRKKNLETMQMRHKE
jgi:hypothetical protein